MADLIITSDLIFPGSADTHAFFIDDTRTDRLVSYSGFLDMVNGDLQKFQPEEMILYRGNEAMKISKNLKKRVKTDPSSDLHGIRQEKVQGNEQRMLITWTFISVSLMSLD